MSKLGGLRLQQSRVWLLDRRRRAEIYRQKNVVWVILANFDGGRTD